MTTGANMTSLRLRFAGALLTVALASPLLVLAGGQAPPPTNVVSASEKAAGWISLFDGKTLDGWNSIGEIRWSVVDGAMVADPGSQPASKVQPPPANLSKTPITWASGFLRSVATFADFEMTAEFWSEENTNSGLFIRCAVPTGQSSLGGCYGINISDPHAASPAGSIVGVHSTLPNRVKSAGRWSRFDVTAEGPHLVVKVNGETTTDARDEKLKDGALGLQAGGPTGSGIIKFRNLKIRPLRPVK
jgi:hypothetical protein